MITVYYKKVFPLQEEDTFSQINLSLDRDMTAHPVMKKLDKRRRERISRIKNEKARAREITAGVLLHDALCRQMGVSPSDTPPFSFSYGERGKPYLAKREDIHFNISHSGDYVCAAVSDKPVGVDIQFREENHIRERKVAERFFTAADRKRLGACAYAQYHDLFYRIWSIRESYVKLTGEGMSGGLSGFEIDWEMGKILDTKSHNQDAFFQERQGIINYSLSVCTFAPQDILWEEMETQSL